MEPAQMKRREFLVTAASAILSACTPLAEGDEGRVMTVRGPIEPSQLGLTLPHEHLFSNFGGEAEEPTQYDDAALLDAVEPYLRKVQGLGCRAIADATAAWFGRRPDLLRTLSMRTGVHIITNTGYYGAANDRYIPPSAYQESADELAARWVREFREGIGEARIRPGFLKIGVDEGPLSDIDRKLIVAAARTHRETGLTIAVHTGGNPEAAEQQMEVLSQEGVAASAWIWVHANNVLDIGSLEKAAARGAWISLDGLSKESTGRHWTILQRLREGGFLAQVLLSHDGNSYRATGREPKAYDSLFVDFLPYLRAQGWQQEELAQLTENNPQQALTIRKRLA